MVIGDIGHGVLQRIDFINGTFWASKTFPKIFVGIFLFYFALKREIQELKGASLTILIGVVIFILSVSVLLDEDGIGNINFQKFSEPKFNLNLLGTIPIVLFAYQFQSSFYPIYSSLENKTPANGMKSIIYALIFCSTVYIIMSVVAVLKYGEDLEGDVLTNIGDTPGTLPIIIDIIFLIIMVMHIPLIFSLQKNHY
jgi:amino acid permease